MLSFFYFVTYINVIVYFNRFLLSAQSKLSEQSSSYRGNDHEHDHDADSILQELIEYKMKVALISAEMENEIMKSKNLTNQLQKERELVESLRRKK